VCAARLPQAYVAGQLGARYVEPQPFRLDGVYADSAPSVPLIFVLSFGSDPMTDLLRFADEQSKQVRGRGRGRGFRACVT
jgi:dynein heavy chain